MLCLYVYTYAVPKISFTSLLWRMSLMANASRRYFSSFFCLLSVSDPAVPDVIIVFPVGTRCRYEIQNLSLENTGPHRSHFRRNIFQHYTSAEGNDERKGRTRERRELQVRVSLRDCVMELQEDIVPRLELENLHVSIRVSNNHRTPVRLVEEVSRSPHLR